MIIRVGAEGATLESVDDLKSFKIVAPRDAAFALGDAGQRDGDVVWVSETWLRRSTANQGQEWRDRFETMVAFARSKGWYSEAQHGEPAAIRAHIEWVDA